MSNASLKEQLQALSLEVPAEKRDNEKKVKAHSEAHPAKQKPAWLEYAQYGVELLKAHYPACFKDNKELQPLKVGIKQDLVKLLSSREDIVVGDKSCMVSSLSYYVNSPAYHKSVVAGATRIDLDGNSVGTVTPEEANYSIERSQAKLRKKKTAKSEVKETEQVKS